MALKINNQIGCDQGITDQAYIRINTYNIDKVNGNIDIHYSTYLNEEASKPINMINSPTMNRSNGQPIRNNKIGDSFNIPLKKEVVQTTTTMQRQPIQKEVTSNIETTIDGVTTTEKKTTMEIVMEEVAVTNEVKTMVADMTLLDDVNVFAFCYDKLKQKLLIDFNDIVDC